MGISYKITYERKTKVLSLFDGMSCGMLAMLKMGMEVESYDAYEIDEYAIKVSKHNFPIIKQHGNVFNADFTEYYGVDYLIGGSPCTYWSIAQKNNRETTASGLGWELFSQYVRALHEAKPRYFIYENNKSMSKEIRASIDKAFGFEAVCINSALVSAQNRQRLYWVGIRQPDGTYSKADVQQPVDKGILVKDILESGVTAREKAYCLKHQAGNARDYLKKHHTQVAFEPVRIGTINSNSKTLTHDSKQYRVYSSAGKSTTLCGQGGGIGAKTGLYMCPTEPNGKQIPIYEVIDGFITYNGIKYEIKLADGYYIIRKLTIGECMRLQTVPEWYDFSVISNSQAYKCLGNGWTVDVIAHILSFIPNT